MSVNDRDNEETSDTSLGASSRADALRDYFDAPDEDMVRFAGVWLVVALAIVVLLRLVLDWPVVVTFILGIVLGRLAASLLLGADE